MAVKGGGGALIDMLVACLFDFPYRNDGACGCLVGGGG